MKPLCPLTDAEVTRFGEMTPEDFESESVPEDLVPVVWAIAQRLLEARLCRAKFRSERQEATALGEHASWGNRGNGCSALAYLVRNVRKAVVRENKAARNRPPRPSRDRQRAHNHDPRAAYDAAVEDTPYGRRLAHHVQPEPGESIDEYTYRVSVIDSNRPS